MRGHQKTPYRFEWKDRHIWHSPFHVETILGADASWTPCLAHPHAPRNVFSFSKFSTDFFWGVSLSSICRDYFDGWHKWCLLRVKLDTGSNACKCFKLPFKPTGLSTSALKLNWFSLIGSSLIQVNSMEIDKIHMQSTKMKNRKVASPIYFSAVCRNSKLNHSITSLQCHSPGTSSKFSHLSRYWVGP